MRKAIPCLCLAASMLSSLLGRGVSGFERPAAIGTPGGIIESIEVQRDGDLLVLPVTIDQTVYSFVLDTGCVKTEFDVSLVERLRPTKRKRRAKEIPGSMFPSPTMQIGRGELTFQGKVLRKYLQELSEHAGYEIHGCLGMDFLRNHIVEIDFDRGLVSFLKAVPRDAGTPIALTLPSERRPTVKVSIGEGIDAECVIETGGIAPESVVLDSTRFQGLVDRGAINPLPHAVPMAPYYEIRGSRVAPGGRIQVGDFQWRELALRESRESGIGLRFLSRFHVILDFPGRQLHLKPGRRFNSQDQLHRTGISLRRSGKAVVIQSISEFGLDFRSGLREGDQVLQVAGCDANELTFFQIRQRISDADSPSEFRILRDGREMVLVVRAIR